MSRTNVLLMGDIGTGKTTSLQTITEAGRRLFVLALEPGIDRILTHGPNCHWKFLPPAAPTWDMLRINAEKINRLSVEAIIKTASPMDKRGYEQFIALLESCAAFTCDVCGEKFGPLEKLDPLDVVAVDGLSGLSTMAMDCVAGSRVIRSQAEWGIAMDLIERFITTITATLQCSFVLLAHTERDVDELNGGTRVMPSTLGRKLAPKLPRPFDEVVYCYSTKGNFWWSTTEPGMTTKSRVLAQSDQIKPDFKPLLTYEGK